MAYKFQVGAARLSGALHQEGAIQGDSTISASSDLLAGQDLTIGRDAAITRNADIDGTLDVAGAVDLAASGVETDIRGTLSVDEAAIFDANVTILGDTQVGNNNADRITFNAQVQSNFVSDGSSRTVGAVAIPWEKGFFNEVSASSINALELTGALKFNVDVDADGGIAIDNIYDNTVDSQVSLANYSNFTDDTFMIWDDSAGHFYDSALSEAASALVSSKTVKVTGEVSASTDLKAGGALDIAGAGDIAGKLTLSRATGTGLEVVAKTKLNGDVDLGDAATDAIRFRGDISSSMIPSNDSAFDIGSSSDRWANIYADNIDVAGAVQAAELSGALEYGLDAKSDGGLAIDNRYDNTVDSEIRLKNVANFSDNAIQVWDESNNQFEDSIMTDDGSLVTVAGALSASGQLDIDGASNLDGAVAMGSTATVASKVTVQSNGMEITGAVAMSSTLSVAGDANFEGNIYLGASGDDVVYLDTGLEFSGSVIPETDSAFDLGSSAKRWSTIYVDNIVGADLALDIQRATANGTAFAAGTDLYICGGSMTALSLPSGTDGKVVRIKRDDSCTGNVTLSAAAGESFDDGSPIILEEKGASISCIYFATTSKWYII